MSEIHNIQGLDILTYLRKSGVQVDDQLCSVVPDEVAKKTAKPKALCVIDALFDDKKGILSSQFPDYYNRFPEPTNESQALQLQEAFQRFVEQILFGKQQEEACLSLIPHTESVPDILSQQIETMVTTIRGDWLHWAANERYQKIVDDTQTLLALLHQKYKNPLRQSDAVMIKAEIVDIIPDEYIDLLHDILVMLCTIYNTKFDQIQADDSLWPENFELIMDIHEIASFIHNTLAWQACDTLLQENTHSVNYFARELIKSINVLYFLIEEKIKIQSTVQKKPPKKG